MEAPTVFQVIVTPGQTLFIFDTNEIRYIYTDRTTHPDAKDLWPTRMGDSIGHWDGDTLVIDTVARIPGPIAPLLPVAGLGVRAHFIERVRRIDRDTLQDELTIEDPDRFTQPWKMTLTYSRVTNMDRMLPTDCENDRNPVVAGKLVITPPSK
jgi:hypothetical protein